MKNLESNVHSARKRVMGSGLVPGEETGRYPENGYEMNLKIASLNSRGLSGLVI